MSVTAGGARRHTVGVLRSGLVWRRAVTAAATYGIMALLMNVMVRKEEGKQVASFDMPLENSGCEQPELPGATTPHA